MKLIIRAFPIFFLFLLALVLAPRAQAQSFSVFFGAGTATDKAAPCLSTTTPPCPYPDPFVPLQFDTPPKMTGTFGKFGGDFMFNDHLGFGVQVDTKFSQAFYEGLNYRPTFFDLNGIYHPIPDSLTHHRLVPEFEGGVGAVRLSFYYPPYCDQYAGCQSGGYAVEESTHFEVHGAVGVKLYVKGGIFVKPQVDLRYVPNFFQFGSNFVPEYSASLGYTFGRR